MYTCATRVLNTYTQQRDGQHNSVVVRLYGQAAISFPVERVRQVISQASALSSIPTTEPPAFVSICIYIYTYTRSRSLILLQSNSVHCPVSIHSPVRTYGLSIYIYIYVRVSPSLSLLFPYRFVIFIIGGRAQESRIDCRVCMGQWREGKKREVDLIPANFSVALLFLMLPLRLVGRREDSTMLSSRINKWRGEVTIRGFENGTRPCFGTGLSSPRGNFFLQGDVEICVEDPSSKLTFFERKTTRYVPLAIR